MLSAFFFNFQHFFMQEINNIFDFLRLLKEKKTVKAGFILAINEGQNHIKIDLSDEMEIEFHSYFESYLNEDRTMWGFYLQGVDGCVGEEIKLPCESERRRLAAINNAGGEIGYKKYTNKRD